MEEVYAKFAHRLVALARSQLRTQFQSRVDADDVMQSVFRSFVRRHLDEAFEFDDWGGVWALLAKITVRKCHRVKARQPAKCRDIRREENPPLEAADDGWPNGPSREPNPAEVIMFRELLVELLERLPAEKRDWLVMRLQGYSVAEISAHVGRTTRAVYRLLDGVRLMLQDELNRTNAAPDSMP